MLHWPCCLCGELWYGGTSQTEIRPVSKRCYVHEEVGVHERVLGWEHALLCLNWIGTCTCIESYVSNSHIGFDPDYECH